MSTVAELGFSAPGNGSGEVRPWFFRGTGTGGLKVKISGTTNA